jgi:hypothetical protein
MQRQDRRVQQAAVAGENEGGAEGHCLRRGCGEKPHQLLRVRIRQKLELLEVHVSGEGDAAAQGVPSEDEAVSWAILVGFDHGWDEDAHDGLGSFVNAVVDAAGWILADLLRFEVDVGDPIRYSLCATDNNNHGVAFFAFFTNKCI